MPWMIVVILLTLLDTLSSEVACKSLPDIYWNATNPIFRIDNTDHIIDVNKNNLPFEYDQVNIICPVYPHSNPGTAGIDEEKEEEEQYIIYNVSKEEYNSCRITNPSPRIIAVCDKPNQLMYFTITFRSFTPQPGGLEFIPGNDYYFVSTSAGDPTGLHQRVGGRCQSHNMKVIFKVCCSPTKGNTSAGLDSDLIIPASPVPTHNSSSYKPSDHPKPTRDRNHIHPPVISSTAMSPKHHHHGRPTARPSKVPPPPPYHLRPYEVPIEDEMDRTPPEEKSQADEIDKNPKREEAKNDELVKSSSSHLRCLNCTGAYYCVIACLIYQLLVSRLYR